MKRLKLVFIAGIFHTQALAQFVQKEFMIAANWAPMLVMETATPAPADYNGDGFTDLGSRINSGPLKGKFLIDYYTPGKSWFQKQGWPFQSTAAMYGTINDVVLPADYDGDGKADIAVFFPTLAAIKIDYAKNGIKKWDASFSYSPIKNAGKIIIPVVADFDGDKKADISFKTTDGRWLFDFSNNKLGKIDEVKTGYGDITNVPVPADYDGDSIADISIKSGDGLWKIDFSRDGFNNWDVIINGCGDSTEIPVPADYDGDGRADISVKNSKGSWKVAYTFEHNKTIEWLPKTLGSYYGGAAAIPLPADYNGDGKADFGFVLNTDGRWLIDNFSAATNGYDWVSTAGKAADDYNTARLNPRDLAAYTKLKKASFNLITDAPLSMLEYDNQKDYYMALISRLGINTMISDPHVYKFGDTALATGFDKTGFVDKYKTKVPQEYKKLLYAINLGDEPAMEAKRGKIKIEPLVRVKQWTTYFEDKFPSLPTFNNLLPLYGFASPDEYINYLNRYKQSSNSPFVCFDHYPFRKSGSLLRSYFQNLSLLKATFSDRALWSTAWSAFDNTGDIYNATDTLIRFMAFCPVAYGAKGIAYFPYEASYNVVAFKDGINNDVAKYKAVKNINLFLKNIIGPVVINYTNTATLHKGNTFGYRPAEGHELLSLYTGLVKDVSNENILLGVFEKKQAVKEKDMYLWIMNKDTGSISKLMVSLRGNFAGKITVSPRVINYIKSPLLNYKPAVQVRYNKDEDTTTFVIDTLAACEGIMVKVKL